MGEIRDELVLVDDYSSVLNQFINLGNEAAASANAMQMANTNLQSSYEDVAASTAFWTSNAGAATAAMQNQADAAANSANALQQMQDVSVGVDIDTAGIKEFEEESQGAFARVSSYASAFVSDFGSKIGDNLKGIAAFFKGDAEGVQQAAESIQQSVFDVGDSVQQMAQQVAATKSVHLQGAEGLEALRNAMNTGLTPMQIWKNEQKAMQKEVAATEKELANLLLKQDELNESLRGSGIAVNEFDDAISQLSQKAQDLAADYTALMARQPDQSTKQFAAEVDGLTGGFKELKSAQPEKPIQDADKAAKAAANGGHNALLKKITGIAAGYLSLRSIGKLVMSGLDESISQVRFQARFDEDSGNAIMSMVRDQADAFGELTSTVTKATNDFMALTTNPQNIQALNELAHRFDVFSDSSTYDQMASGIQNALRTGEMRSLSSATGLSMNLMEQFKIPDLAKEGNVAGFIEALEQAADAAGMTNDAMRQITESGGQQWKNFLAGVKNGASEAATSFWDSFAPAIARLNDFMNSEQGAKVFSALTAGMQIAGTVAGYLVNVLISIVSFVGDNFTAIMTVAAIAVGIFAVKMGIAAISSLAAAWPLLLIVGFLGAMVTALLNAGVTAEEICGVIGGVVGSMVAFIYNRFIDLWNFIAVFVNFFGNAFNDPIGAIKVLFLELEEWVVKIITNIASSIETLLNKIPGVKVDMTSGLENLRNRIAEDVEKAKNEMEWIEYVKQKDYWNPEDAWTAGEDIGKNLGKSLDEFDAGNLTDALNGFSGDLSGFSGMDNIGSIGNVGSVGKIKGGEISLADEDLKMMMDAAERRNRLQLNQTLLAPNVSVKVENHEGEKLDENKLAGAIAVIIEKASASHTDVAYDL